MPSAYRCGVRIDGRLSRSRFRETFLAGALLASAAAPATAGAPKASVPTRAAIMDQQNKEFVPYVLAVGAGTPVSFPNNDNVRHNVYSVSAANTTVSKN
jgi:plastocyanin